MNIIAQKLILAVAKSLLSFAAQKAIGKALPSIYEKIDTIVPTALFNRASPEFVKSEIAYQIRKTTGRVATHEEIEIVASLYNPVANAKRLQRKPR